MMVNMGLPAREKLFHVAFTTFVDLEKSVTSKDTLNLEKEEIKLKILNNSVFSTLCFKSYIYCSNNQETWKMGKFQNSFD